MDWNLAEFVESCPNSPSGQFHHPAIRPGFTHCILLLEIDGSLAIEFERP